MRYLRAFSILSCLVVLASLVPIVQAQTTNATVNGLVVDISGAVIVGASVKAINEDTNIVYPTTTNTVGVYSLPTLPPGRYRMQVSKDGFKTLIKPDIILNVQDARAVNFTLTIGAVSEIVTVEGGAPLVNTQDAAVSTVVDRQFVENLPLNGRSFQTLIALTPGTVITKATFTNQGQFSVNGQRANANYLTVDGASANIGVSANIAPSQVSGGGLPGLSAAGGFNNLVSVDAMQEFRVQTSTYAPEFGRTPGGQISILTRSGANQFHGTLFNYFRNDALDANDWFANRAGLRKAPLRQNDFGGVLGGPIVKNRTFFFFSYEGLRLRLPQTNTILVPSVATRQAAPPEIQPVLNAYPIPTGAVFPDGTAEFSVSYADPSSLNATSIRIDQAVSSRLNLFGRYAYSPSNTKRRLGNLSSREVTGIKTQTLTLGMTWGLTPRVSNDFRANYSRNEGEQSFELDDFGGAVPPPDSALFPASRSRQDSLFTFIVLADPNLQLLLGKFAENVQRQVNLVDTLSVIAGGHHLKFGVDYRRLAPINNRGGSTYTLAPFFLDLSAFPGGALSGTTFFTDVDANEEVAIVFHNFSAYAQDTWRAKPRLTLTYGLRWEVNPAPKGKNKDLFTFDNLDDQNMLAVAPAGTPLYETVYHNFAPRVGVAYAVSQKQSWETVLRGGFGIFYDLGSGGIASAVLYPYFRSKSLFFASYPLSPQDAEPPPISFDPPFSSTVADRNLKLPYTYHWNVSLEQSLGPSQTFSASYVGAVGRRLLRQETLNGGNAQGLAVTRNKATSDYHALQLQFNRRLSRGLQALASYTWSHSIDISSSDTTFNTVPAERADPNIDRGSSEFDVRHSFNAALTYDIPTPNAGRLGRAILGNWSADTVFFARTAPPVNLAGGFAFIGFLASVRPDVVPGQPLYVSGSQCDVVFGSPCPGGKGFNPAAFAPPPTMFGSALRQGTLGRNVLRGFGAWQADFALRRKFSLTERVNLQFRAEFFNVFNHPNFGDPNNFFSPFNPFFGQSTQMLGRSLGSGGSNGGFNPLYQIGGPRSIQFALRLTF